MAICPKNAVIVHDLVRQALVSAQEVMGENGLNAVLRDSGLERFFGNFPPNDTNPGIKTVEYARFNEAIESFYGRDGKGMLWRIGKASFQYGVREQSALMGVAGAPLKLMPQKGRIKFVLNAMVNALKKPIREWMLGLKKKATRSPTASPPAPFAWDVTATSRSATCTSAQSARPCAGPRIKNTESPKRTASPKATRLPLRSGRSRA